MFEATSAKRRRRALAGLIAGLGAIAGFAACNEDNLNLIVAPITTRAVVVFKDSAFNFTTLTTFAMPDSVIHFVPATGTPVAVSRQFDRVLLDRVRQDFIARGYILVTDPSVRPSFVVLVGTSAVTTYNAFIGYPWFAVWGFWPGWQFFTPGFTTAWGIIYPWEPIVGTTAYDPGTVLVDLIPTSSINPVGRTIQSAWTGVATALLTGSITSADVTAAVDEMFTLSPYLVAPTVVLKRRP